MEKKKKHKIVDARYVGGDGLTYRLCETCRKWIHPWHVDNGCQGKDVGRESGVIKADEVMKYLSGGQD